MVTGTATITVTGTVGYKSSSSIVSVIGSGGVKSSSSTITVTQVRVLNVNTMFANFGLLSSPVKSNIYPITGLLDLPKRKGIISHDWGTTIEPFLSDQDIEFDGRKITMSAIIKESNNAALLVKLSTLKTSLLGVSLTLITDISTHTVFFVDEMKVKRLTDSFVSIEIPFFEPIPVIPSFTGTATGGIGFKMAGFNLRNDFAISIIEVSENMSIPPRIDVNTTDYYKITEYRQKGIIKIDGILEGADIFNIKTNWDKFISLMASPEYKLFVSPSGETRAVYCSDGIQIKEIYPKLATFSLTLQKA